MSATWFHSHGTVWVEFSAADNSVLEHAWQDVQDKIAARKAAEKPTEDARDAESSARSWIPASIWSSTPAGKTSVLPPPPPPPTPNLKQTPLPRRLTDPDEPEESRIFRVPVLEDRLFDVDLLQMIMYPALWPGYDQRVVRAIWFYVASDGACSPIAFDSPLSHDLEHAYNEAKPWNLTMRLRDTLSKANKSRRESIEKKSADPPIVYYDLPSVVGGAKITFSDANSARVYPQNISSKLFPFLKEPLVARGYDCAQEICKTLQSGKGGVMDFSWANRREAASPKEDAKVSNSSQVDGPSSPERPSTSHDPVSSSPAQGEAGKEAQGTIVEASCTVSDTPSRWTAFSEAFLSKTRFKTAEQLEQLEQLEQVPDTPPRRESASSQVGSIAEELDGTNEPHSEEKAEDAPHILFCIHGIGQKYSEDYMATDFVHELDRFRGTMRAQMQDPNMKAQLRNARVKLIPILWRRDLQFEPDHGAYTLQDITNHGSIPAVRAVISKVLLDIPIYMSHHRTTMLRSVTYELNRLYRLFLQRNPDFEEQGGKVSILVHAPNIHRDAAHLLFNVEHFFCVGSPVPMLYYLNGSRLVARHRSASDYASHPDVSSEKIFTATDPISFKMSATVDATYARMLRPVELPRDPALLQEALEQPRLSIGSIVRELMEKPPGGSDKTPAKDATLEPSVCLDDGNEKHAVTLADIEMGERRFHALNPYGCIDFVVDTGTPNLFTQYIDMLRAHVYYWTSPSFANFILRQLIPSASTPRLGPIKSSVEEELELNPATDSV
ncbi:hypothetical protein MVES_001152 [Malassezia vespertilionis]|uniref:DDHD domain-containing protein n=1 Tax=Malassezia vespertilionis TaxID=2020962 RepID=A0A2N1JDW7_9BASI|nr:hypothetical protein MVES_001152 [Malassezia vespertilionis]